MARKGPFTKKVLPAFWFITDNNRNDGRSGHMYTCPLVMTLSMFVWRIKLRDTHSVNWERSEEWFHTDDRYESARIIARNLDCGYGFTPQCLMPVWAIKLEILLREKWRRWKYRRQLKRGRS